MFRKQWLIIGMAALLLGSMQGCAVRIASGANASKSPYDRRTEEAKNNDTVSEWKVCSKINDRYGANVHVNCKSFNGMLLLAGEVPDEDTKAEIVRLGKGMPKVKDVRSYLRVAPVANAEAQNKDRMIESAIRSRGKNSGKLNPEHVQVVSEFGLVFLFGVVSQPEADSAIDVAMVAKGIKGYIPLFEIISPEQAKALDDERTGGNTPTKSLLEMLPRAPM